MKEEYDLNEIERRFNELHSRYDDLQYEIENIRAFIEDNENEGDVPDSEYDPDFEEDVSHFKEELKIKEKEQEEIKAEMEELYEQCSRWYDEASIFERISTKIVEKTGSTMCGYKLVKPSVRYEELAANEVVKANDDFMEKLKKYATIAEDIGYGAISCEGKFVDGEFKCEVIKAKNTVLNPQGSVVTINFKTGLVNKNIIDEKLLVKNEHNASEAYDQNEIERRFNELQSRYDDLQYEIENIRAFMEDNENEGDIPDFEEDVSYFKERLNIIKEEQKEIKAEMEELLKKNEHNASEAGFEDVRLDEVEEVEKDIGGKMNENQNTQGE